VWNLVARNHLVDLVATDVQQLANADNVDDIVVEGWLARGTRRRCVTVRIPIGKQRRQRLRAVGWL
jgi:hypothetical protein